MEKQKVVVIGLGYIGLPTAALIASKKIEVLGVDIKKIVVETINQGKIHIAEPDLEGLVQYVVEKNYLKAGLLPQKGDTFVITVPTPFKGDHKADISFVEAAIESIIPILDQGNLVIIESTSPVGTTDKMAKLIFGKRPELKGLIHMAYCPERVLPGRIIYELENNDRVIGGVDKLSTEKAYEFYSLFVKGVLHKTDAKTAEMCKLAENSYRDVNIAFANELSILCDKYEIDVRELISLTNKHPRVKILQPGCGVGGHCIAVDPWFLVDGNENEAIVIKAARERNNRKADWVCEQVVRKVNEFEKKSNRKPKIAVMGLAFKPDIDDLRESPALGITKKLISTGLMVLPVEPNIEKYADWTIYNADNALSSADIVVFLVGHKEFKALEKSQLSTKIVLDYCGVFNK